MRRAYNILLVAVVLLAVSGGMSWAAGLETADPELPPTGGQYVAESDYVQEFYGGGSCSCAARHSFSGVGGSGTGADARGT